MKVYPMIDRTEGQVLLIYRDEDNGKSVMSAEVYKFFDPEFLRSTHFAASSLELAYVASLTPPSPEDMVAVEKARAYFAGHLARYGYGNIEVELASEPFTVIKCLTGD